jgi:SAM-dependent methyltransferase
MMMIKDPLGMAIQEYWKNPMAQYPAVEVFMNGEVAQEMPASLFFRSSRQLRHYERIALKACRGPVLDVGAASGMHSMWLQERGVEVTSLEISERCCTVMMQRGLTNVVCEDVFTFSPKKTYATVLALMNGTGLAGSLDNLIPFLQKIHAFLMPKGRLLIDSSDIMYYYRGRNMPLHVYYGDVEFAMKYKNVKSNPFPWTFVDADTLNRHAQKAGFSTKFLHVDASGHYLAELTRK